MATNETDTAPKPRRRKKKKGERLTRAEYYAEIQKASDRAAAEADGPQMMFKVPNRLMVEREIFASRDQSVVEMNETTAEQIGEEGVYDGETILIKGKTQTKLVSRLKINADCEDGEICMNDVARRNLRIKLKDMVTVNSVEDTPFCTEVEVAPVKESIEGLNGDIQKIFLWNPEYYDFENQVPLRTEDVPFFHAKRKPTGDPDFTGEYADLPRVVCEGQLFKVTAAMQDVWFKVISIKTTADPAPAAGPDGGPIGPDDPPAPAGLVARASEAVAGAAAAVLGENKKLARFGIVKMEDGTTQLKLADPVEEGKLQLTGYADVGGLSEQLTQIREMVELPLRHPKLFKAIGAKPPKGVLMHGPPGCGKTLIARAICNETGANFKLINGPEIMSGVRGKAEKNLRDLFKLAEQEATENGNGAIIFIDEIDSIAPNREKVKDETLRRIVATLLTLMDGLNRSVNMMVIGATNRPNTIDPALRRSGRFDAEICIPVPSTKGRREILEIVTKKQKKANDVDIEMIAEKTFGYVGADLAAVAMKAATACIRRSAVGLVDMDEKDIPAEFLDSLRVTMQDYRDAIESTGSSMIRDVVVSKPNVSFKDIGGLEDVKKELQEMINFPSNYEDLFADVGVRPPTGALMYGPPGCGKTLLAKAMAAECDANFISIKGPQLLTKWFGESEENIRGIFEKARQSAPCVLFFDELDAVAAQRGGGGGDQGVGNRVVNQLLTEMDGVGKRKNVFIIGATNRPGLLDRALLRPGRLDQKIYIPMPDADARRAILLAKLRKTPYEDNIDFDQLASDALTGGMSGADLAGLCQMAVKISVRKRITIAMAKRDQIMEEQDLNEKEAMKLAKEEFLKAGEWKITAQDMSQAFTVQRKSVSGDDLEGYTKWAEARGDKASTLTTNESAQAVTHRFEVDDKDAPDW